MPARARPQVFEAWRRVPEEDRDKHEWGTDALALLSRLLRRCARRPPACRAARRRRIFEGLLV